MGLVTLSGREMSGIVIKSLVVPFILFDLPLCSNPNPTPWQRIVELLYSKLLKWRHRSNQGRFFWSKFKVSGLLGFSVCVQCTVYMKRWLSVANLSLENNLPMFLLNASVVTLMMTGAFSRNVGKLFSELKLVRDNFIYAEANWEATENIRCTLMWLHSQSLVFACLQYVNMEVERGLEYHSCTDAACRNMPASSLWADVRKYLPGLSRWIITL